MTWFALVGKFLNDGMECLILIIGFYFYTIQNVGKILRSTSQKYDTFV